MKLLYLLLGAAIALPALGQERLQGQAPDWLLSNAEGDYVSFYEDSGSSPSLMLFWTPTCKRQCLAAMEQLHSAAQQAGIKSYLLMNSSHTRYSELPPLPAQLAPLFKAHAVGRHYGVRGEPTWVLVDRHKNILKNARIDGAVPALNAMLNASKN